MCPGSRRRWFVAPGPHRLKLFVHPTIHPTRTAVRFAQPDSLRSRSPASWPHIARRRGVIVISADLRAAQVFSSMRHFSDDCLHRMGEHSTADQEVRRLGPHSFSWPVRGIRCWATSTLSRSSTELCCAAILPKACLMRPVTRVDSPRQGRMLDGGAFDASTNTPSYICAG